MHCIYVLSNSFSNFGIKQQQSETEIGFRVKKPSHIPKSLI